MVKRIIIAHLYKPSSAATNRIIAYAKSFAELGRRVTLVLGCSQTMATLDIVIEGVDVCVVRSKQHYLLVPRMARKIKEIYERDESAILFYGSSSLCLWMTRKKYNIYFECTEIPLYGRKKTIVSTIKEKIKAYLSKRATGMFVISKALKEYFSAQGIANIAIVNMFVDTQRFDTVLATNNDEKYIAYCGTISPFKDGVDCLIKAFALFYQAHSDYKLKLIGRFESKDAEQQLRGIVDKLNLSDAVCFTGMVSPSEMPALLCGAKMLALARPDNEQAKYGFPTKLGEYLATGKPVVVTRVGEIGDYLQDGENCRMAAPGDERDFADKMSWVADNYEEALQLGEKGKKLTQREFSCIEQSKKALAFIQSTVSIQ